jgi:shikimate kinase
MDKNMVILVIGPSGVGKSECGKYAEVVIPDCHFFDLDEIVSKRSGTRADLLLGRIGPDAFLDFCKTEVDAISKSYIQGIAVVAVGAGALQSLRAGAWLSQHPGPTLAVFAPAEEVRRRPRNQHRRIEEFKATEFSQHRQGLYEAAKCKVIVAGLTVEEARVRFSDKIRDLFTKRDGSIST